MSIVKAEIAGKVVTLLGYDGADFYNVLIDTDGHIQIDVIGSALPVGAATEAKQALILAELEEKLETADLDLDGDGKLSILGFGYDGVTWWPLLVDALGHLQVDALTCGLPPGAATDATLATLATEAKLELCRLLLISIDGVDFATGVDIGTILTELQLKADLTETQSVLDAAVVALLGAGLPALLHLGSLKMREQNPIAGYALEGTLATVNTTVAGRLKPADLNIEAVSKDLQVDVKASALPTGAATAAWQDSITDANVRQVGYSLGQVMLHAENLNTPAASTLLLINGPTGTEEWLITAMEAHNDKHGETGIFMGVRKNSDYYWVTTVGTRVVNEGWSWSGEIIVTPGDDLVCYHLDCTAGDDIFFNVFGHIIHG